MIGHYLISSLYAHVLEGQQKPKPPQASQATFITNNQEFSRYHTFIVPEGIYFLSAVLVSLTSQFAPANQNNIAYVPAAIRRGGENGVAIFSTSDALNVGGVGGGNGGQRGMDAFKDHTNTSPYFNRLSGGGAGGYSGDGGYGGNGDPGNYALPGGVGSGGGGGGGAGYTNNPPVVNGSPGGPIGLLGKGSDGIGGVGAIPLSTPTPGGTGSPYKGPFVGAGDVSRWGGDLRWKNNIPVSPGETLIIDLGSHLRSDTHGIGAGCRIIYGDTRSYPTNAQNAMPQGQVIINGKNTTWIVPPAVGTVCACAQQYHGNSDAVELIDTSGVRLRAVNGNRIGTGGDGGVAGTATSGSLAGAFEHGGGGGGSYDGDGGPGGNTIGSMPNGAWESVPTATVTNSRNKGGAGSAKIKNSGQAPDDHGDGFSYRAATAGTGIGIKGRLPDGSYLDPVDGNAGGGAPGYPGGALAYINNLTVVPGAALTINAMGGRVRIIYGPDRSYPLNAFDL